MLIISKSITSHHIPHYNNFIISSPTTTKHDQENYDKWHQGDCIDDISQLTIDNLLLPLEHILWHVSSSHWVYFSTICCWYTHYLDWGEYQHQTSIDKRQDDILEPFKFVFESLMTPSISDTKEPKMNELYFWILVKVKKANSKIYFHLKRGPNIAHNFWNYKSMTMLKSISIILQENLLTHNWYESTSLQSRTSHLHNFSKSSLSFSTFSTLGVVGLGFMGD